MMRLTVGDLVNFWAETDTTPMHIALAAVVRPGSLVTDGELDLAKARSLIAARLGRALPLTRRVRFTRLGEGLPVWVDDVDFDIRAHVESARTPPMNEAAFFQWCANEATRKLDRRRPLWRVVLVPHVEGDHVGMLITMHHAIADGLRGVALVGALLDTVRTTTTDSPAFAASTPPSTWQLVVDNVSTRTERGWMALKGLPKALGSVRARVSAMKTMLDEMQGRVPSTPLAHARGAAAISSKRRLMVTHRRLDDLRDAAHRRGVTVNDLGLAAVSMGLRTWLLALGAAVDRPLRASVPIGAAVGNANGVMLVPLPVDEPSAAHTLERINTFTKAAKSRHARDDASWAIPWAPLWVTRLLIAWMRRFGRGYINAYMTNVPGPPTHLWLGDAEVLRAVPISPLVAGVTLSVALFSYGGEIALVVHVDDAVPHTTLLGASISEALDTLIG